MATKARDFLSFFHSVKTRIYGAKGSKPFRFHIVQALRCMCKVFCCFSQNCITIKKNSFQWKMLYDSQRSCITYVCVIKSAHNVSVGANAFGASAIKQAICKSTCTARKMRREKLVFQQIMSMESFFACKH